jgi:regulator of RNase E activity RraA
MPIPEVPPATLELLGRYDTPTICNVIELFAVRPRTDGYMDGRIRACFPEMPPIVGYASTATYRGAFERRQSSSYATLDDQIKAFGDLPGPAVVVFQDLDDPPVSATFGEVMCTTYQAFGAAGLITSGAARDVDQVRRIGFPVFASGVICSHGYSHFTSIHEPVRVGGIAVRPGDLLHADVNGVTTIPHEIASEVAAACDDYMACEAVILDHLKTGDRSARAYSEARQECMRQIAELGQRVRARTASA